MSCDFAANRRGLFISLCCTASICENMSERKSRVYFRGIKNHKTSAKSDGEKRIQRGIGASAIALVPLWYVGFGGFRRTAKYTVHHKCCTLQYPRYKNTTNFSTSRFFYTVGAIHESPAQRTADIRCEKGICFSLSSLGVVERFKGIWGLKVITKSNHLRFKKENFA